jgi:hypothetical protein
MFSYLLLSVLYSKALAFSLFGEALSFCPMWWYTLIISDTQVRRLRQEDQDF